MMLELSCTIPVPQTSKDLDLAIQTYRTSDLDGFELFCQWQAIRDASLEQSTADADADPVPGGDSY